MCVGHKINVPITKKLNIYNPKNIYKIPNNFFVYPQTIHKNYFKNLNQYQKVSKNVKKLKIWHKSEKEKEKMQTKSKKKKIWILF